MLIRYYFDPDSASVPFILVTGEKNIEKTVCHNIWRGKI